MNGVSKSKSSCSFMLHQTYLERHLRTTHPTHMKSVMTLPRRRLAFCPILFLPLAAMHFWPHKNTQGKASRFVMIHSTAVKLHFIPQANSPHTQLYFWTEQSHSHFLQEGHLSKKNTGKIHRVQIPNLKHSLAFWFFAVLVNGKKNYSLLTFHFYIYLFKHSMLQLVHIFLSAVGHATLF